MKQKQRGVILPYIFFSLFILIACSFVFVLNHRIAYDTVKGGSDLFPPYFTLLLYFFIIVIASVLVALFLKWCFRKRINRWVLLAIAFLMPIVGYGLNHYAFKENSGPLYPLVNEGGILHFIAIGDFNLDGVSDKEDRLLNSERTVTTVAAADTKNQTLRKATVQITGVGKLEQAYCSSSTKSNSWSLHYDKDQMTLQRVEIRFEFVARELARATRFYLIAGEERIELTQKLQDDGTLVVTLDEQALAYFRDPPYRYVELPLEYVTQQ